MRKIKKSTRWQIKLKTTIKESPFFISSFLRYRNPIIDPFCLSPQQQELCRAGEGRGVGSEPNVQNGIVLNGAPNTSTVRADSEKLQPNASGQQNKRESRKCAKWWAWVKPSICTLNSREPSMSCYCPGKITWTSHSHHVMKTSPQRSVMA